MANLRLVELSAATIVAVNNMSLKPGQEQYLAPISYGIAATVINPQTSWQRVVLDANEVVGFVSAMLFDVQPMDPAVFTGVAIGVAAVATLATVVPARRASRVESIVALRAD